jgi:hypothetical protein
MAMDFPRDIKRAAAVLCDCEFALLGRLKIPYRPWICRVLQCLLTCRETIASMNDSVSGVSALMGRVDVLLRSHIHFAVSMRDKPRQKQRLQVKILWIAELVQIETS